MWYPATVVTVASAEPLSLDVAKRQVGVVGTDKNDVITAFLTGARAYAEKHCGILIAKQTVAAKCDSFADFCRLRIAPVRSVVSVKYVDTVGDEQTLSTDVYEVRNEGLAPSIVLKHGQRWPAIQSGSRITVTAEVGYDPVPPDLTQGILVVLSKLYALGGRDVSVRSEDVEGVGSTQWGSIDRAAAQLDTSANILLENYRSWAQ
jgi:uncharacterized phiE125 gp8 family phage protein